MPRAPALLRLLLPLAAACAACAAPPPSERASPEPVRPERSRGAQAPAPAPVSLPAPAGIRLSVDPSLAARGSEVTLVLSNGTSARIGYNLCMSALERLDPGGWRQVPVEGACTRELRTAAPGAVAYFPKRLPAALDPGTYRYVTRVEVPLNQAAPHRRVEGEPFRVR